MHLATRAVLVATLVAAPLHAQAGCPRVDAAAITRVIHRQGLATEPGRAVDDGNGICRVTFGGDAGPTQVIVVRMELDDVAVVRETMRSARDGGTPARTLPGVGDEAFVTPMAGGDGAAAYIRDGTTLVNVQMITQRGTMKAHSAAAADVARVLFGRAATEPATVAARTQRRSTPAPTAVDTTATISEARSAHARDAADAPDEPEHDPMTPIQIPGLAEGPGDVCDALPARTVRESLAAAGLAPGSVTTTASPGLCIYTFGTALTDSAVRVAVQYAGTRDPATAAALVASMRRRAAARPLAGVGDEAAVLAAGGNTAIAYRAGRFSGLVEVLAPAAAPPAVRAGAERVARAWVTRLAVSSNRASGGTR